MKHTVLDDVPYLREAIIIETGQNGALNPDPWDPFCFLPQRWGYRSAG